MSGRPGWGSGSGTGHVMCAVPVITRYHDS